MFCVCNQKSANLFEWSSCWIIHSNNTIVRKSHNRCAQDYFAIDKCHHLKWNQIGLAWNIHIIRWENHLSHESLLKILTFILLLKVRPINYLKKYLFQRFDHSALSKRFMKQMWTIELFEINNQTFEVDLKHYISRFWAVWMIYVKIHFWNRFNEKVMKWNWFSDRFDEVLHQTWWDISWS